MKDIEPLRGKEAEQKQKTSGQPTKKDLIREVKKYIDYHLKLRKKEIKGIESLLELNGKVKEADLQEEAERIFNESRQFEELRNKINKAKKDYQKLKPKEPPAPPGTIKDKGRGR